MSLGCRFRWGLLVELKFHVTELNLSTNTHKTNTYNICLSVVVFYSVCSLVCTGLQYVHVCTTALHTLLAATFHRLLHVLCDWCPVVAFEGEPPPPDPQRSTAGGSSNSLHDVCLAATPTLDPGERFRRLAEDGATPQPVVIPDGLASTWRLCRWEHRRNVQKGSDCSSGPTMVFDNVSKIQFFFR